MAEADVRPWLFKELHLLDSFDQLAEVMFGLKLKSTQSQQQKKSSTVFDAIMSFLFSYVHQAEYMLHLHRKERKLSEAQLITWDIPDEAMHEILVGSLLARLGTIPQALSHVRRSMELIVEAAFLSTSYIEREGIAWNPFVVIYMSNKWQAYTARGRTLRARKVFDLIKSENLDSQKELANFTRFYLMRFASRFCDSHLSQEIKSQDRLGPDPLWTRLTTISECSRPNCASPAMLAMVDHVPSIDLMEAVVAARLSTGYDEKLQAQFDDLYSKASGFVHVTREAHHHESTQEHDQLWESVTQCLLGWESRTLTALWRWHDVALPGLLEYLAKKGHSFNLRTFKEEKMSRVLCGLFLGKKPEF